MRKVLAAAVVVAAVLAAGCGGQSGPDGPQHNVFEVAPPDGHFSGPAWIQRILDLGFPPLHNLSGSAVKIVSVSLVSPGPHVRLLSAYAYRWAPSLAGQTVDAFGDLPKECPTWYVPRPLSAAVTRPHSDSPWSVMLVLRISRPGTYRIWKVKVVYEANGQRGWQYFPLYDIVHEAKGYGPRMTGCAAASG